MDFIDSSASLSLAFWEDFDSTNGIKALEKPMLREDQKSER
jgi:hypothetical protein